MNKKVYYSWEDVEHMLATINNEMAADGWRPDYIVGMSRGGLVPAVMLSNMSGIPMHPLGKDESNLWMSEDAFGYEKTTMNILIVDDINDTGATFNWIKEDWPTSCMPMEHDRWNAVWGGNVRFATLTDNSASNAEVPVSYTCHEINKAEEDVWLVYPWENVGEY